MATDSAKTKTVARSVLLGLLLAASVAAALGYTMLPTRQARSVVAEIRQQGLSEFYPPQPLRLWYRQTQADTEGNLLTGWVAESWTANGELYGGSRINYSLPNNGLWEIWTLNEDATEGIYYAGEFVNVSGGWSIRLVTVIRLVNGWVTMAQRIGPDVVRSTAEAPDTYLPEGTVDAAAKLMSDRRGRATFSTIFNALPPDAQGRPTFLPLSMGRANRETADARGASSVVRTRVRLAEGELGSLLYFDANGHVDRRRFAYHNEILMSPEEREALLPVTQAVGICDAIQAEIPIAIQRSLQEDEAWRLFPADDTPPTEDDSPAEDNPPAESDTP
jgi:hypothetical protein